MHPSNAMIKRKIHLMYWHWRAGKREQCLFCQESSCGCRKNEAKPPVSISALWSIQCFNTNSWAAERTFGSLKPHSLNPHQTCLVGGHPKTKPAEWNGNNRVNSTTYLHKRPGDCVSINSHKIRAVSVTVQQRNSKDADRVVEVAGRITTATATGSRSPGPHLAARLDLGPQDLLRQRCWCYNSMYVSISDTGRRSRRMRCWSDAGNRLERRSCYRNQGHPSDSRVQGNVSSTPHKSGQKHITNCQPPTKLM